MENAMLKQEPNGEILSSNAGESLTHFGVREWVVKWLEGHQWFIVDEMAYNMFQSQPKNSRGAEAPAVFNVNEMERNAFQDLPQYSQADGGDQWFLL